MVEVKTMQELKIIYLSSIHLLCNGAVEQSMYVLYNMCVEGVSTWNKKCKVTMLLSNVKDERFKFSNSGETVNSNCLSLSGLRCMFD